MPYGPLADVHAHLDMEPFDPDREETIERARQAGLRHILCVGPDLVGSRAALDLARAHPDLMRSTVGIQPG